MSGFIRQNGAERRLQEMLTVYPELWRQKTNVSFFTPPR
ncbi:Uncharacterized protein EbC_31350 [Erwinia billingiae Eb661]|uniref:Transposase n=1 Tax=Erwinia billingiae (strain Eb661) TaxID=634500 RepID=D8MV09_ERWBE|nr:Uncharacterized protein EbC_31350 [Erwinia billingiae Eb661]